MTDSLQNRWRFGIDRGGTFTDIIGLSPDSQMHTAKVLSESSAYEDSGIEGIRRILDLPAGSPLPEERIAWIRMGTTVATNALLERKGARTGLLITRGFRDLLEIGTQERPDLFALAIHKPAPLYSTVVEVAERIGPDGKVLDSLDATELQQALADLKAQGVESLAIVFLHAWKNPEHENMAARAAEATGFSHVSTSSGTMPLIQVVGRGRTTLIDAYLSPLLASYVARIEHWVGNIPLYFMSSSGDLMAPHSFSGKDAILSGPAGGVLGVAELAEQEEDTAVLGFDMGGTSTDVCRYGGQLERILEVETAGVQFTTPMLHVETVAAGGGSIVSFDGQKLTVGPESAGADPGPACYGRDGPATITDANLILGRIQAEYFPQVFGPAHNSQLDISAAHTRLAEITAQVELALDKKMSVESLALGFIRIANEAMSRPIKELSVARGHDPRNHVLLCFGGAGAQHACGIARALAIKTVRIPPMASLLSAYGILRTSARRSRILSQLQPLNHSSLEIICHQAELISSELEAQLRGEHHLPKQMNVQRQLNIDLCTPGSDSPITLPLISDLQTLEQEFYNAHRHLYGFSPQTIAPEIVNLRVEVFAQRERAPEQSTSTEPTAKHIAQVDTWFEQKGAVNTPVHHWQGLTINQSINGPALIIDQHSTVVVEPGFSAMMNKHGVLTLTLEKEQKELFSTECDPVLLEIFHHLFKGVAGQMGDTLTRTAHSVNIKERKDFSCAVFDRQGRLVANAPHIPVHLGAMGETVRHLIETLGDKLQPGDAYCSNDPFAGGSHLPDITVIKPIFRQGQLAFFVAARGHHADIGGTVPGSMPPSATRLEEEGVVLRNLLLMRNGEFQTSSIETALTAGPYPARNLSERLSDLRAQVAACHKGGEELNRISDQYSDEVVFAYMEHIRHNARTAVYEALEKLLAGDDRKEFKFSDCLDNGAIIAVCISLSRDTQNQPRARVDFSGSANHLAGNLNAPPAITRAAVLYVFRSLISQPIPLNEGCLEPIEIILPPDSLLNPPRGSAVAGGNVETSQRIVDVLYGALGIAAASQGTMNNFLFGATDGHGSQYYETIAGGAGATEGADGASGVQVHMTNTRITDPEVLEIRFPAVRLEQFTLRKGSGGKGQWPGGDGVIRVFYFNQSQSVSLLTERRKESPFGIQGGKNGACGKNILRHRDDTEETLPGHFQGIINEGDVLEIHTPGGGGFGTEGKYK